MLSCIHRYAQSVTRPSFRGQIPSNFEHYERTHTLWRRVWMRLKRDMILLMTGQLFLAKQQIPASAVKILYVYLGTPQLGDSIMDLSSRVLWQQRGVRVDLYTHGSIAAFYRNDPSFERVISDPKELQDRYDFVVLQSYGSKCLKFKWRYFFCKPFTALHGYYYGCEFNRLEFADAAWHRALNLPMPEVANCPPVFNLSFDHASQARFPRRIAVALGGVVQERTYRNWIDVIRLVHQHDASLEWVLLGSSNGVEAANSITKAFGGAININNCVDCISLSDVFKHLQVAGLLVASDGGLLHVGRAAQTPIVALFAGSIHPRMRFAWTDHAHVIHAPSEVSEIESSQIAKTIIAHLNQPVQSLTLDYLGLEPNCVG
jgi:Glycosyltransferase family 9 (heptosyltransferase)